MYAGCWWAVRIEYTFQEGNQNVALRIRKVRVCDSTYRNGVPPGDPIKLFRAVRSQDNGDGIYLPRAWGAMPTTLSETTITSVAADPQCGSMGGMVAFIEERYDAILRFQRERYRECNGPGPMKNDQDVSRRTRQ